MSEERLTTRDIAQKMENGRDTVVADANAAESRATAMFAADEAAALRTRWEAV